MLLHVLTAITWPSQHELHDACLFTYGLMSMLQMMDEEGMAFATP